MMMNLNMRCVPGEGSTSRFFGTVAVITAFALPAVTVGAERAFPQRVDSTRHVTTAVAESDSAAVAAVVERYHRALESGDSVGALALLTTDAVILESGGIETREEYRSHHLPADIAFARAVKSVRGPVRVVVRADVAWATSTSTTEGEFRGRPINSAGAELMVLTRTTEGWKINAIHWSSRSRRS
jgi:ketosteroid isomerase-like protein